MIKKHGGNCSGADSGADSGSDTKSATKLSRGSGHERNAPKLPLSERLLRSLDIPLGTFGKISFIEAAGNREVNIEGCVGLSGYTSECVALVLCDGFVTIRGRELELSSYSGGRMSVSGFIASIDYGKESLNA